jgi:hypothetical protein
VSIVELFDQLPGTVTPAPATVWSVFARSLGEQGADGRTALAWRWALTGTGPSPVTLRLGAGIPPGRLDLISEATADAELARPEADPGGQVMHARLVLSWLAGDLPALPLWNGAPQNRNVTNGVPIPRRLQELHHASSWALLAHWRNPSLDGPPR